MNAVEFVKKEGLWVFEYALAQLSFNKGMFLVVYHYECEFVSEVKDNHGDCVFSYRDVKQIVDAFELVESLGGMAMAKDVFDIEVHEPHYNYDAEKVTRIEQAINLVEQCQ